MPFDPIRDLQPEAETDRQPPNNSINSQGIVRRSASITDLLNSDDQSHHQRHSSASSHSSTSVGERSGTANTQVATSVNYQDKTSFSHPFDDEVNTSSIPTHESTFPVRRPSTDNVHGHPTVASPFVSPHGDAASLPFAQFHPPLPHSSHQFAVPNVPTYHRSPDISRQVSLPPLSTPAYSHQSQTQPSGNSPITPGRPIMETSPMTPWSEAFTPSALPPQHSFGSHHLRQHSSGPSPLGLASHPLSSPPTPGPPLTPGGNSSHSAFALPIPSSPATSVHPSLPPLTPGTNTGAPRERLPSMPSPSSIAAPPPSASHPLLLRSPPDSSSKLPTRLNGDSARTDSHDSELHRLTRKQEEGTTINSRAFNQENDGNLSDGLFRKGSNNTTKGSEMEEEKQAMDEYAEAGSSVASKPMTDTTGHNLSTYDTNGESSNTTNPSKNETVGIPNSMEIHPPQTAQLAPFTSTFDSNQTPNASSTDGKTSSISSGQIAHSTKAYPLPRKEPRLYQPNQRVSKPTNVRTPLSIEELRLLYKRIGHNGSRNPLRQRWLAENPGHSDGWFEAIEEGWGKKITIHDSDGNADLERKRARDTTSIVHNADVDSVADHYNKRQEVGLAAREKSPILPLKKFNNWVKSVLISSFTKRGNRVLDLGGGKGGDLNKWGKANVSEVILIDIAETSVQQAEARYNDGITMRKLKFAASFFAFDCFSRPLSDTIPASKLREKFSVVSLQFCMHYGWGSIQEARVLLENVTQYLVPGGIFMGTIPNSDVLYSAREALVGSNLTFGNSYYKICFDQKEKKPPFGDRYTFWLEDAVENVAEYVVQWDEFINLAQEYGLHCIYRKTMEQVWREDGMVPRHNSLAQRMDVGDPRSKDFPMEDEDLWEAASLYLAFAFEKR